MAKTIALKELPGTADIYRRAIIGMLPVVGKSGKVSPDATLPDTELTLSGVKVDLDQLAAYCAATGQRFGDTLPLTFPFVLQFPLVMKLLVAGDFPLTAIGSVHIENTIERYRPIGVTEPLTITTHAENLREHRKGMLVDVISEFAVGHEPVARQTATFLSQQRTSLSGGPRPEAPKDHRPPPPDAKLKADLGLIRQYAAASGDRNPIHMSDLGAKAFGFPRAIAHGMWTAARVVANVEGRLDGKVTYNVRFGKPVILPATVNVYTKPVEGAGSGAFDISVLNPKKGYPHLTATLR
ncbi:MaoC family dehydratase [Williamsia soli]|uniref:MaoC family dehydratase n=1 Tax=Williamsia soli TaxID=364929 RepID=UPI001A9D835A|nr:MaoC/PaaZ C-terminal domain-containing protein [Williamsia soli]